MTGGIFTSRGLHHPHVHELIEEIQAALTPQRLPLDRLALKKAGVRFDHALLFPWPVEAGAAGLAQQLDAARPRLTAVFTYNDELAVGLAHFMQKDRRGQPSDFAIATRGNTRLTRIAEVPLMVVDENIPALAVAVVERLLAQIQNPATPPRRVVVKPFLVSRASAAELAHGRSRCVGDQRQVERRCRSRLSFLAIL